MNKKKFNKIYMNCKRGMLELDIILMNFLENGFLKLNYKEIKIFELFLLNNDQDLYEWLIKDKKSKNTNFNKIIFKIKNITSSFFFN